MKRPFRFINHQVNIFRKQKTSLLTKAVFYSSVVTISAYVMLFSDYPAVHDYFHELRHALAIVPCH